MKAILTAASLCLALSVAGSAGAEDAQAQSPNPQGQPAAPAGANGGARPLTPKMQGQTTGHGGAAAANDSGGGIQSLNRSNLRQQLQQQLSDAGYTSIKIMPSSFYVQAKDKEGRPVAMIVTPDSVTAVTDLSAQNGADQSGANAQNGSNGQGPTSEGRAASGDQSPAGAGTQGASPNSNQ